MNHDLKHKGLINVPAFQIEYARHRNRQKDLNGYLYPENSTLKYSIKLVNQFNGNISFFITTNTGKHPKVSSYSLDAKTKSGKKITLNRKESLYTKAELRINKYSLINEKAFLVMGFFTEFKNIYNKTYLSENKNCYVSI